MTPRFGRPGALLLAGFLALGACSSKAPLAGDSGSPSPSAAAQQSGSPAPTGVTPGATSPAPLRSASPGATASPLGEPNFRGNGCYPDIPTPFAVEVTSDKTSYARGERATLTLTVRATGASRVEHANAQEFDFALETQGQEVWRWSSVAPLIQPFHYDHAYSGGEVRTFTATWDQKYARSGRNALPGAYLLHGYFIGNMKSPPPPGRFICFDDARLTVA